MLDQADVRPGGEFTIHLFVEKSFEMNKIPFARVSCDGNELEYVREVLKSGWLTTAGKAFEFEKKFAKAVGASHACAVNSCTAALHLALEAIGIGPGTEVLVPTLTFTATAEVVRYLGADPVFVDVEYGSGLITAPIIQQALESHPKVKAVMVVHFAGQAANMPAILEVCRTRGVRVVEDAAHAFPTRCDGRMIGSWGDITCFSFYANKTITTGEGGMVVTEDESIAKRVRVMRLHGIDRDIWNRFTDSRPSWEYDVVAPGFKYNLPDLAAAVGLAQLERAYEFRNHRQIVVKRYMTAFEDLPGVDLPQVACAPEDHSWHFFWLVLGQEALLNRDAFIEGLIARGIGFSVHYKPLHHMTYYKERYNLRPSDFPNAERHWRGCVSLPLYSSMSEDEMDRVIRAVRELLAGEQTAIPENPMLRPSCADSPVKTT
jgi:dTDP-4-amino-4,6-dideoxygalactose transaminase